MLWRARSRLNHGHHGVRARVPPETGDDEGKYVIAPWFWIPEDNLSLRVARDHVPYDTWHKQGFLQTTEGNVVYYATIEAFIEQLGTRFDIREIAYDRWGFVQMSQKPRGARLHGGAVRARLQRHEPRQQRTHASRP